MNELNEYRHNGKLLFRYVDQPQIAADEGRMPYFTSVCTLAGDEVTLTRPYDHPWHKGLAMTMAVLSKQNFWGGGSYVHGEGYRKLDNIGQIAHIAWDGPGKERLEWITAHGQHWLAEQREISVSEVNETAGYWRLDLRFALENISGQPLHFGSPTTEGRPMAGYGGLFWRGPRSFLGGKIMAQGGLEGPAVMGQSAAWLAFSGGHDGSLNHSTIVFCDRPTNPRFPTKWFVRNDPYACLSCSFMFDEEYELPPQQKLVLAYQILIANGELTPAQIDKLNSTALPQSEH